jgi:hypothetical protein
LHHANVLADSKFQNKANYKACGYAYARNHQALREYLGENAARLSARGSPSPTMVKSTAEKVPNSLMLFKPPG